MILDEVCDSRVYGTNAFYVLGLPVDVTSRKIRRRREDVIEGCALMGDKAWRNEFDKYLLGSSESPTIDQATALFERLKDPEYFATEMFFWFWPQRGQTDPAVEAMLRGERDVAVRFWQADMNKAGEKGVIARHNLAVILHFYAVDGENYVREQEMPVEERCLRAVDQYWQSAFEFWEDLSDDDLFWDVFAARVATLDDPRLNASFIDSFRSRFPVCFDNINADFLVSYAQRGWLRDAKRHFDYMVSTMSGVDDVEETMERAFTPMVDKVRTLIKQCKGMDDPTKVLEACRELLTGSSRLVEVFKALVPNGNAYTSGVLNEIVSTIDNRLPIYSRETGDYEPCLQVTKKLLVIAATPLAKEKIQKSIGEWQDLIRQERERSTCCVCGCTQKGIGTKKVEMYRDVRADPMVEGRVEWRTRTISDVPVCAACSKRFRPEHARSFTPVKRSLEEGWKIGAEPTEAEMAAVLYS